MDLAQSSSPGIMNSSVPPALEEPSDKKLSDMNERLDDIYPPAPPPPPPPTSKQIERVAPVVQRQPKKKKLKKQANKSKMVTGYIIYASEIRKEIIKQYPEKDFGEISKIVGVEWKNLAQESKVTYEKKAQEQNTKSRMEFLSDKAANELITTNATGALELNKLADVAAARAANEETQQHQQQQEEVLHQQQLQQQQQQQQHPQEGQEHQQQQQQQQQQEQQMHQQSFMHNQQEPFCSNQEPFHISSQEQFTSSSQQQEQHQQQSQIRSPMPMTPYANGVGGYPGYNQQSAAFYPQLMGQSTPILIRPNYNGTATPNDILLQQQQAFSIVQHSQPSTNVQYCNNPACCASGRYQPYNIPIPYSPPAQPVTPSSLQQQQQQQLQQQAQSIKQSPSQQQLYKRNNIIYRKPTIVKLRPKDAATQTDPITWVEKIDKESPKKQQLRFSNKFIEHINLSNMSPSNCQLIESDSQPDATSVRITS